MAAGDYRKLATLEQPIRGANDYGGKKSVTSWEAVTDIWVSVDPYSARELYLARGAASQTTHRVRCRWFAGLTSDMRFTWLEPDGEKRILNIDSRVDDKERHVEWVLECIETKRA